MATNLYSEIQELRRRLSAVMSHARQNEQILRRYQELELKLISASNFKDLVHTMLYGHRKTAELDAITLALIDPEYEIQRMLKDLEIELADFPDLLFVGSPAELPKFYGPLFAPILGPYQAQSHAFLFPTEFAPPESIALLPLIRQQKIIGSLNLGSHNKTRFASGMATDFLQRLAAIVAICLENVTNNERLKHIGLTDPLTGVHNRRYIEQRLREEVGRVQRQGYGLSCLFLDVDHFKQVNDQYGHQVGDFILREVSARINGQLRLSDALGRYGGEEFIALLVDTDETDALLIAERIRHSVEAPSFEIADARQVSVTLSIGVATLPDIRPNQDIQPVAEQLVAAADKALYQAKQNGRNQVASGSLNLP